MARNRRWEVRLWMLALVIVSLAFLTFIGVLIVAAFLKVSL